MMKALNRSTIARACCWCFLLLFPGGCSWTGRAEIQTQPIRYSHQKHVGELGIDCEECHITVASQARASIPNLEVCGMCHAAAEADSAATETDPDAVEQRKVELQVGRKEAFHWKQIHTVPDYVYFSHRRHVTLGRLECLTCHGDVAAMAVPFSEPFVTVTMAWCIGCHQRNRVSNDCYACHR